MKYSESSISRLHPEESFLSEAQSRLSITRTLDMSVKIHSIMNVLKNKKNYDIIKRHPSGCLFITISPPAERGGVRCR